jgi:hypothetical protein
MNKKVNELITNECKITFAYAIFYHLNCTKCRSSENVLLALVSFNGLLLWLDSYWVPVRLHVLIKGRSKILLETLREACFQIVTLGL